jgi:serine/threonine protein phosphatase PrpC
VLIPPTEEQTEYLTSTLGVRLETITRSTSVSLPEEPRTTPHPTEPKDPGRSCLAIEIVLLIALLLLLAAVKGAQGEAVPVSSTTASLQAPIEEEPRSTDTMAANPPPTAVEHTAGKPDGKTTLTQVSASSTTPRGQEEGGESVSTEKLETRIAPVGPKGVAVPGTEVVPHFPAKSARVSPEDPEQQIFSAIRRVCSSLQSTESQMRRQMEGIDHRFRHTTLLLAAAVLLLLSLLLKSRLVVAKQLNHIQKSALTILSESAAGMAGTPSTETAAASRVEDQPSNAKHPIVPNRPASPVRLSPREHMEAIIQSAAEFELIRAKPRHPRGAWSLALATAKGNVRSENQDYGLCFQIGNCDVLILADGCGGIPRGQRAAHLATISAAVEVVRLLGMSPRRHSPDAERVAANAMRAAEHRLAVEGDKLNFTDIRDGLRTTLIVVVGNRQEIGFSYVGDGGGCVLRSNGRLERFLVPQKASQSALNVLAASLGPRMEGDPVTGRLVRTPGDFVVVGTDGIFDRVGTEFIEEVLAGCKYHSGDLQKAAEQILEELSSFQDSAGYVCDDNLTIGIMGDGKEPSDQGDLESPGHGSFEKPSEIPIKEAVK